jgi:hypothetical protein
MKSHACRPVNPKSTKFVNEITWYRCLWRRWWVFTRSISPISFRISGRNSFFHRTRKLAIVSCCLVSCCHFDRLLSIIYLKRTYMSRTNILGPPSLVEFIELSAILDYCGYACYFERIITQILESAALRFRCSALNNWSELQSRGVEWIPRSL